MDNNDTSGNVKQLVAPSKYPLIALLIAAAEKYNEVSETFYKDLLESETVKANMTALGTRLGEICVMVIPTNNATLESIKRKDAMLKQIVAPFLAAGKAVIAANAETVGSAKDPVEETHHTLLGKVLGFKKPKFKVQFADEE